MSFRFWRRRVDAAAPTRAQAVAIIDALKHDKAKLDKYDPDSNWRTTDFGPRLGDGSGG
ncbi:MAG: hypothetical protein ACR2N4_14400 [Jatrophihabitans sp.]